MKDSQERQQEIRAALLGEIPWRDELTDPQLLGPALTSVIADIRAAFGFVGADVSRKTTKEES